MNRKQKRHSSKRITGSTEPFMVDWLQSVYRDIFATGNVVVENLLDLFRENSKIAVALRMSSAVDMNRPIIAISTKSREIIIHYLNTHKHAADSGYIICTLRYFLREKPHNFELNLDCTSCKSRDPDKALTHAKRDCEKYRKRYINQILRRLKERPWTNLGADKVAYLCKQYESIEFSVEFICKYLTNLCNKNLPSKLDTAIFAQACQYDPTLALHYNMADINTYTLNSKRNHSVSSVNQECATYIFCATYR